MMNLSINSVFPPSTFGFNQANDNKPLALFQHWMLDRVVWPKSKRRCQASLPDGQMVN